MPKVLIVEDAVKVDRAITQAMKQAIVSDGLGLALDAIDVVTADQLALVGDQLCPLTLDVPEFVSFPGQAVFRACRDVVGLRQTVAEWQYAIGAGNLWLPVVLTAKGPLYAEVIGKLESEYLQPIHVADVWRQDLYQLAHRLIRRLMAPPAVYLMQFDVQDQTLRFDRLIPFPAAPAIASLTVQTPNLFVCHWRCLSGQAIQDLVISSSQYQICP